MIHCVMAQRALMIQHADGLTDAVATSTIDSLTFSDDGSLIRIVRGGTLFELSTHDVTRLSYAELPASCLVTYLGTSATVINPYFTHGVSVSVHGADVVIDNQNTETEFTFELSGETTDGSLLYNGEYKATIVLNGVNITNTRGAAIDIECGKRIALELKKNTVNTLSDGKDGTQKAALYCKGHLEIDKAGMLNVTGNSKHAISAKEYIQLKKADGTINILGAVADGIHCSQYFLANGYNVNITGVAGDGIQAELSDDAAYAEAYPDGSLSVQGGTFSVSLSAEDVVAMKADTDITLNTSKGTSSISISTSGAGGKGIKAGGTLTIGDTASDSGPVLTVSTTGSRYDDGTGGGGGGGWGPGGGRPGGGPGGWGPGGGGSESGTSAKAIKAKGAVNIYGGELSITTAGSGAEGLESKTSITIAGGRHYLKCYDDCINSSGKITFSGGITVCHSTGNDAIDSNYGRTGAIVIGDGTVLSYTTKGSPEMGFDCDGNSFIQITGHGIAISAGGNQGGSGSSALSNAAQGYAFVTSNISYQKGRYYTLSDSAGTNLVTYSFDGNLSSTCSMFTATGMTKGSSYTVKYGTTEPTDALSTFHGLYLGSSAQGTNNVTSFTAK